MDQFLENIAQAILANTITGLLAAGALLLVWGRLKQRLLVDANKVPLVELNHENQSVRNVGSETALNCQLYHMVVEGRKAHVRLAASLPNLMSGEIQQVEAPTYCGVIYQEVFLLQYNNATGSTFQALIELVQPRGDAQVVHPPYRLRGRGNRHRFDSNPSFDRTISIRRWIRKQLRLTRRQLKHLEGAYSHTQDEVASDIMSGE